MVGQITLSKQKCVLQKKSLWASVALSGVLLAVTLPTAHAATPAASAAQAHDPLSVQTGNDIPASVHMPTDQCTTEHSTCP